MADAPAQNRPGKDGKPQYRPAPDTEEAKRKRRNSANRILTMLKAILNFAYKKKHVTSRDAWGSDLERFGEADARRIRFLSVEEAKRLVEACDPDFADLVRAALETGARYSELARLRVQDFSHNGGTLFIEKSKSAKARHIDLTEAGIAFFQRVCAGRSGGDIMLKNLSRAARRVEAEKEKVEAKPSRKSQPLRKLKAGDEWRPSEQVRLMNEACERAAIDPPIVFHELRHTYASILIMNAIPLIMIAENLGHKDTSMVVKHYGHLAPSFKKDMIRERGPKYGLD
jgi:integrase